MRFKEIHMSFFLIGTNAYIYNKLRVGVFSNTVNDLAKCVYIKHVGKCVGT